MSTTGEGIPYERQADLQSNRTCGAACLSMVYRSLGKEVPQSEIWPAIAKENRFGSMASTTHLMVQDALNRGFSALAIQVRPPLQALRFCRESGIRVILNHQLKRDSPLGHYSVFVNIDADGVTLHDPLMGPSRHLSHAELLELWQPRTPDSEILGNVLIGITAQPTATTECWLCRTPLPPSLDCPSCKKPFRLQPSALLGCTNNVCITRLWNYVCCPFCDFTWTFSFAARESGTYVPPRGADPSSLAIPIPATEAPPPALEKPEDPFKLEHLFGELDKFCNHIRSLPKAANNPDIKAQLDFIVASKEKLKLAQAETLAHQKMHQEKLVAMLQQAKQKEEAHRKKMEELNKPSPPLDGDALGRALLKNLGFTE